MFNKQSYIKALQECEGSRKVTSITLSESEQAILSDIGHELIGKPVIGLALRYCLHEINRQRKLHTEKETQPGA